MRSKVKIMPCFLFFVFLALGGGAFGDTQVFNILSNLSIGPLAPSYLMHVRPNKFKGLSILCC